jgi:hypothetical protein
VVKYAYIGTSTMTTYYSGKKLAKYAFERSFLVLSGAVQTSLLARVVQKLWPTEVRPNFRKTNFLENHMASLRWP